MQHEHRHAQPRGELGNIFLRRFFQSLRYFDNSNMHLKIYFANMDSSPETQDRTNEG